MLKTIVTIDGTTYQERARWERRAIIAGWINVIVVVLREDGMVLSRNQDDPDSDWRVVDRVGGDERNLRSCMLKRDNDPTYTRIK